MLIEASEVIGNMRAPARPLSRPGGWSFSASLGFHLLIGFALLEVAPRRQATSWDDSITVDVLTQQQFEAASSPPVAEPRAEPMSDASATPTTESPIPSFAALPTDQPRPEASVPAQASIMVQATHLQSARVLADKRSAKMRKALGQLAASERIVQLCNIEAMEQVHLWKAALNPDFLVAYAIADIELSGQKLKADGGAFRSKRRWYHIRFVCEVTPDLTRVVSFAFTVGSEIPKSDWADHNLLADDGSAH